MRLAVVASLALWSCHAVADADADRRLCARVLDLHDNGLLRGMLAEPSREPGQPSRHELRRADGTIQHMRSIVSDGTCYSVYLARGDDSEVTMPTLVSPSQSPTLDSSPVQVDGEWLVVFFDGNRWVFEPYAVGRLTPEGTAEPLCSFAPTGEVVRTVAPGDDDAACLALRDGEVEDVAWDESEHDDERPESVVAPHGAAHALLDWFGDGTPRFIWRITHQTGGCAVDFQLLALADPDGPPTTLDETSPAGSSLFRPVEGEYLARGAWWLDRVFTWNGRAWFAGQPAWGKTTIGDYAVYRLDRDGVHAQCSYRYAPQLRIVDRRFAPE